MRKEIRNGLFGGASLLLLYFIVMMVAARSWSATIAQFREIWYWMVVLSVGFGIQIGLYTHLHLLLHGEKKRGGQGQVKAIAVTSTGTSAISMIACCAHHLIDILPIIGLSGAAVFLTQYQIPLILLGVAMNGFGIWYIIKQIYIVKRAPFLLKFFPSVTGVNKVLLVIFAIVVIVVGYATINRSSSIEKLSTQINNSGGNVTIEVTPQVLEKGKSAKFQILFDTHSEDLLFGVTKVVTLIDDKGNEYTSVTWDGSAPDGHHRNGTITFNQFLSDTQYIELIVKSVTGISERKFRWEI